MTTNGSIYKKTDRGRYRFKRYLTKDCQTCPLKNKCTARDQGRLIERPLHQAYVDRNDNRVRKDMWYYKKRQEIIEHIFDEQVISAIRRNEGPVDLQASEPRSGCASLRQWDMDHTLVRGRANVETEYRLAAICYNLTRVVSIIGIEKLKMKLKKLQKALILIFCRPSFNIAYSIKKNIKIDKSYNRMLSPVNMLFSGYF